jgi:hypothetical protein
LGNFGGTFNLGYFDGGTSWRNVGEPTGAVSFALPLRKLKGALKGKHTAAHREHIVAGILDKVVFGGTRKEAKMESKER